ncbi:hypothetical protein nbrc107696_05800 [Gordonia spumicola]|uniref:Uncharacterized protein n=1 Tax=Gordonia spumicola TaxID=589161 RepID=A0A7I9V4N0_9ACTN|nr:hypothetical protein [Gordonia spumicola]GEE00134.1 hypothetical protein nbrc107696_05800 [Gordonia spumicola]
MTMLGNVACADVTFGDGVVTLREYPFPAASVVDRPVLHVARIRDVDPAACPPEIRTVDGETLFIVKALEPDLAAFAERNGIPQVRRPDAWGLLLEPFLDTSFTDEDARASIDALAEMGVGRDEARRVRRRVGRMMLAYNAIMWDWADLGLADLLTAAAWRPDLLVLRGRARDFYAWAMEIADRPTTRHVDGR